MRSKATCGKRPLPGAAPGPALPQHPHSHPHPRLPDPRLSKQPILAGRTPPPACMSLSNPFLAPRFHGSHVSGVSFPSSSGCSGSQSGFPVSPRRPPLPCRPGWAVSPEPWAQPSHEWGEGAREDPENRCCSQPVRKRAGTKELPLNPWGSPSRPQTRLSLGPPPPGRPPSLSSNRSSLPKPRPLSKVPPDPAPTTAPSTQPRARAPVGSRRTFALPPGLQRCLGIRPGLPSCRFLLCHLSRVHPRRCGASDPVRPGGSLAHPWVTVRWGERVGGQ